MNNTKKYFISLLWTLAVITGGTIILSVLSYFDLINDDVIKIFKLVIQIVGSTTGGFLIGKNSLDRGYQKGIKYGLILGAICLLLALLFKTLAWTFLIFFIITTISSMFGAMIGMLKKTTN